MEQIDAPFLDQFLNFMLLLPKAKNAAIQEFVLEFDKLFLAFEQARIQSQKNSQQFHNPDQILSRETVSTLIKMLSLDLEKIESPERYFQSVQELVNVNVPLEIILQDVLRIAEKNLQSLLNQVHKYLDEKKESQAKDLLQLMIVLAPNYPHLWILEGILQMNDNLWDEAKRSLLLGVIQSPYSLYGLIPLLELTHAQDHKSYEELIDWLNTHKNRLVTDYDTPPYFKKAIAEKNLLNREEILRSLPRGIGNRYSYQIQKQEYIDLVRSGFPQNLISTICECFEKNFESFSDAKADPTLRFFLKIIQKSPSEIDQTVSKQNLYLHSLTLTCRGFFLGLKILKQGFFLDKEDSNYTKDLLGGSLILSFLFTLLILLKQEKIVSIEGKNPFEEILFFMVNALPLSSAIRSSSLVDALIIDIIERI